jgi:glutathione synthase
MSSRRLAFLFVMDPLGSIDVQGDTTFVLMLEAQQRGHRVLHADPSDLAISDGAVSVRARPATLRREPGNHYELGPEATLVVDDAIDVVLQRKDPPVDAEYVTATQIRSTIRESAGIR